MPIDPERWTNNMKTAFSAATVPCSGGCAEVPGECLWCEVVDVAMRVGSVLLLGGIATKNHYLLALLGICDFLTAASHARA